MAQIPVVKLQDPQLDIIPREFQVMLGPAENNYQKFNALQGGGNQVNFNITTPATSIGVSRRALLRYIVKVDCTRYPGDLINPAGSIPYSTFDTEVNGYRAHPLSSTMESVSLKLNNYTFTITLDDVVHALSVYGNDNLEREMLMGYAPTAPDQFATYDSASYPDVLGVRQPFADYGTKEDATTRKFETWVKDYVFNPADVPAPGLNPAPNARVLSFTAEFWENILISPLNSSARDVTALFGIQTIDLVIVHSNLNRMLAGVFPVAFANYLDVQITGSGVTSQQLFLQFLSPQQTQEIPSVLVYPTWNINRYLTADTQQLDRNFKPYIRAQPEGNGTVHEYNVNAINFNSIPDRVFIYAQQPRARKMNADSNICLKEPDVWGRIEKISINFDNKIGILSSAMEKDLHWISCSNGSQQTWNAWHWYQGSVLCLQFGKDIPLSLLAAPGSRGVWQFSCTLTVRNLRPGYNAVGLPDPNEYTIYTIPVTNGVLTVNDSVVSTDVGFLTMADLANAQMAPAGTYAEYQALSGGSFKSFMGNLWSGIKRAAPVIRDVVGTAAKVASQIAPMLAQSGPPQLRPAAAAVSQFAPVVAGVADSLRPRGRGKSGGAAMPKRTLSARARR